MFEVGYVAAGLLVGTVVGATGVGGGSLMTPLLMFSGVQPAIAVGTDLIYASATKAFGTTLHGQRGRVPWRIVGLLALGSVPASLLTIVFLHSLKTDTAALSHVLSVTLGFALLLTAAAMIFGRRIRFHEPEPGANATDGRAPAVVTVALGLVLGTLVTLSSVGAGAVGAAALAALYPRLGIGRIVGADIAHAVPLTLVAGLGHASLGTVDLHLAANLLLGSLPGVWLGCRVADRLPENGLRAMLAGMLTLVGGKLAFL
jgi:uncharacterized membrane protein YfcA